MSNFPYCYDEDSMKKSISDVFSGSYYLVCTHVYGVPSFLFYFVTTTCIHVTSTLHIIAQWCKILD
jgi:hypothetical protein